MTAVATDVGLGLAVPIKSTLKPADSFFRAGAKLAAEGAGYGAVYGFGEGEGGLQNRLESVREAAPISAVGATVLGLPLIAGAKVLSAGANKLKSVFSTPEQEAAARLVAAGGDDIEKLALESDNPLYQYETLAEATQNPKLAQIEQQVGKSTTEGNALRTENVLNRRSAQRELLDTVSQADPESREAGGIALRQLFEGPAGEQLAAAEKLFQGINPKSPVPIQGLRKDITDLANRTWEAGGMPSSIKGIVAELGKTEKANPITMLEEKIGRTLDEGEIAQLSRDYPELGQTESRPYSYMHALRMRAQQAWLDAKAVGDKQAAAVANRVWRGVDSAIEEAGKRGMMPAKDVAAFNSAKGAFSKFADTFESGAVGMARQKLKEGQYQYGESSVVDMVFNGRAENTKKMLAALPDTPEAIDKARGVVRDKILRATTNNDGNFSPAGFRKFLKNNKEGLTAEANGKRLFDDEHITALERISDDLAFLDPQSEKSSKSLAYAASAGQPTTAQALLLADVGKSILARIPGTQTIGSILNSFAANREAGVQKILAQAVFDKTYAKRLVSEATPQRLISVIEQLLPQISGDVAGKTPRLLAPISPPDPSTREAEEYPTESRGLLSLGSRSASRDYRPTPEATQDPLDAAFNRLKQRENMNPADSVQTDEDTAYDDLVDYLAPALVGQESAGKTNAVSEENAYMKAKKTGTAKGLWQLLDATGKEWHDRLGIEEPYDPFNAKQNEAIGRAYLKHLLKLFSGDMELALTAYHSGEGTVQGLLKKHKASSLSEIRKYLGPKGQKYAAQVLGRLRGGEVET